MWYINIHRITCLCCMCIVIYSCCPSFLIKQACFLMHKMLYARSGNIQLFIQAQLLVSIISHCPNCLYAVVLQICCCDYEERDVLRALNCAHHFHKDCVDQWLLTKASCPTCRQPIDDSRDVHANNNNANVQVPIAQPVANADRPPPPSQVQ